MRRFGLLLLVCVAAGSYGVTGSAAAAVNNAVAQDCLAHGKLTHHYTVAQLRAGLNSLPTQGQEYGDCGALISNAIYAEVGKGGHLDKTSGGGSSTGVVVVIAIVVVLIVLAGGGLALSSARKRDSSG